MITICKGGTKERQVPINELEIPDLWHIAQLSDLRPYSMNGRAIKEMLLDCWHIAHSLKFHIMENER